MGRQAQTMPRFASTTDHCEGAYVVPTNVRIEADGGRPNELQLRTRRINGENVMESWHSNDARNAHATNLSVDLVDTIGSR